MRAELRSAVVGLALLAGACSPDFTAVLHVTIDGPDLSPGAGYWVDLRLPDGAPLGSVEPTFVAFKPGDQDVTLVLDNEDPFQGTSTFVVRLVIAAAPGEDAASIAMGSKLVTLKKQEVVDTTLTLGLDPRPLNADLVATYDAGDAAFGDEQLTLDVAALPADAVSYHLWIEGEEGELAWLSELDRADGSMSVDPRAAAALVAISGVRMLVTAEPTDSPAPLVGSSGWPILRGGISAELSHALFVADGAPLGVFAAAFELLDVAEQHTQLALNAFDAATPNPDGVIEHGEHVYVVVAGEAAASIGDPMAGDLDGNGVLSFMAVDHTGLGHGVLPDAPGYLHHLGALVSRLETDGENVGLLEGCRAGFAAAVADTLTTAEALSQLPTDDAAAIAFDCAVKRMRGDDSVATRGGCSIGAALNCAWSEAESFAGFTLDAVLAGEP